MFLCFPVPEAQHVKAQDKVLGAIGFKHESRRDDTSANVGFNRATIQIAENGNPWFVTVAFNGAVPPGLELFLLLTQDFVLGFHRGPQQAPLLRLLGWTHAVPPALNPRQEVYAD